ncbi:MAG: hypothetical protein H6893_04365 [Brucellaceae bacterium]|nr:hypothetical protein [Brucellaceae bacterium]
MHSTTRTAIATAIIATSTIAGAAFAQHFPSGGRNGFNDIDMVTGYRCISPGCDTLQMPNANCICQKQNASERDLSKLRLVCSTKEAGRWVACPVKPPFGN